tara:strand:+ start:213 stop:446 length:234 start_codon:yes stop_codon:yes gene_type:complete
MKDQDKKEIIEKMSRPKKILYSKKIECREIVKEILNFGVDQYQIENIIMLLSLELEDNDKMKKITNILKEEVNSILL